MKKTLSLSAIMLMTTSPVFAQDPILLDEIVVSSGLFGTRISETGSSVDVLTNNDLKFNTTAISQGLSQLSGVFVSQNGGLGGTSSIKMRGLSQNYVAVLVDGMDVTDPSGTQVAYDFGGVNGMGYSQVEVLKGSQSAIYGSEAVAGVVNLKTISENDVSDTTSIQAEIGPNKTHSSGFKHQSVNKSSRIAIALNHVKTDGFSSKNTGDGASEKDSYEGTQLRLALEKQLNDYITISANKLIGDEKYDYDQFDPLFDTTERKTDVTKLGLGLKAGAFTHSFSFTKGNFDRDNFDSGASKPASTFESSRSTAKYLSNYEFSTGNIAIGAEEIKEEIRIEYPAFSSLTKNYAKETAYFGEINFQISENFLLSAAARSIQSKDFKDNTTYRLSTVYSLAHDLALKTLVSTGQRSPSLYEISNTSANITLKPETSETLEIGLEKSFGDNAIIDVTFFNSTVHNLITYSSGYAQSNDKHTAKGLELRAATKLNDIASLRGGYTYTDAKTGNSKAARIPTNKLNIGIDAELSKSWQLSLDATYVSGYKNFLSDLSDMPSYTVINMGSSYAINQNLEAYARVENLADVKYENVKGFNTGGRQVFAGIRASF